ncbi:MAG: hypothetical protein LBT16_12475 [Treponema sp.]|jgi:hypothetical protein|nr:hypothetical protein [Treponema sp.]
MKRLILALLLLIAVVSADVYSQDTQSAVQNSGPPELRGGGAGRIATLTLNLNIAAGRAADPPNPSVLQTLTYRVSLNGPSGSQTHNVTGVTVLTLPLEAGRWNIKVQAFNSRTRVLYAEGSATEDLQAGRNNPITVTLLRRSSTPTLGQMEQDSGAVKNDIRTLSQDFYEMYREEGRTDQQLADLIEIQRIEDEQYRKELSLRKEIAAFQDKVAELEKWGADPAELRAAQTELEEALEELDTNQKELQKTRAALAEAEKKAEAEANKAAEAEKNERAARKISITPEIVAQIMDANRSLNDLYYYVSMPILLQIEEPKRKLDIKNGEVVVEETNFATPTKFDPEQRGALANDPGRSDIFEIAFPDNEKTVALGFVLDKMENRYDLSYAIVDRKKFIIDFSGAKPHLMIYYQANFHGEVFVQGLESDSQKNGSYSGRENSITIVNSDKTGAPRQVASPRQAVAPQQVTAHQQIAVPRQFAAPPPPPPAIVQQVPLQRGNVTPERQLAQSPVWKPDYTQEPARVKPQIASPNNYQTYRVQVGAYKADVNAKEAYNRLVTVGLTGINGFSLTAEPNGDTTRIVLTGVYGVDIPQVAQFCGYAGFKEILVIKE